MNIHPNYLRCLALCGFIFIQGCGGPKYSSDFKSWLGVELARNHPVKVNGLSLEEIAAAGSESVFSFNGTATTTDVLFKFSPMIPQEKFDELLSKTLPIPEDAAREAGLVGAAAELKQLGPIPMVAEPTTEKGSEIKISGKAKATIGNSGWVFSISQLNMDGLVGAPRTESTVVKGSKEEEEARRKIEGIFSRIDQAVDAALGIQAEKARIAAAEADAARKAKEAEAAREAKEIEDAKNAIRSAFRQGGQFEIFWQAQNAQGQMKAVAGRQADMGDTFSVQGVLSDEADEPNLEKPFYALLSGQGSPESPFVVSVKVEATPGGSDCRNYPASSNGFLTPNAKYEYKLAYDTAARSFSGELFFSYSHEHGPKAPVKFMWKPVPQ